MANQYYLIPLTNIPQQFQITLAGVDYILTVKWNDIGLCWFLDIANADEVPIATSIPLITGDDLLDGLAYLGIGGQLFVFTNVGKYPDAVPTLENLGVETNLYFFTGNPNE